MDDFKIGDRIKLKDYSLYADYRLHEEEIGIIVYMYSSSDYYDLTMQIKWNNNETSNISKDNSIKFNPDWDE